MIYTVNPQIEFQFWISQNLHSHKNWVLGIPLKIRILKVKSKQKLVNSSEKSNIILRLDNTTFRVKHFDYLLEIPFLILNVWERNIHKEANNSNKKSDWNFKEIRKKEDSYWDKS